MLTINSALLSIIILWGLKWKQHCPPPQTLSLPLTGGNFI